MFESENSQWSAQCLFESVRASTRLSRIPESKNPFLKRRFLLKTFAQKSAFGMWFSSSSTLELLGRLTILALEYRQMISINEYPSPSPTFVSAYPPTTAEEGCHGIEYIEISQCKNISRKINDAENIATHK
ncbi:hypothetical protein NPIL_21281 [Nephila pilipes]|uniref:Uncharacterized protein n=1 Tax=Nephila pilipes TaxID=299642 RepID=A0A8X6Q448_NEPPI|nr:hypothetical protein NPIL_21281 [Nephila pilipes]